MAPIRFGADCSLRVHRPIARYLPPGEIMQKVDTGGAMVRATHRADAISSPGLWRPAHGGAAAIAGYESPNRAVHPGRTSSLRGNVRTRGRFVASMGLIRQRGRKWSQRSEPRTKRVTRRTRSLTSCKANLPAVILPHQKLSIKPRTNSLVSIWPE